MTNSTTGNPRNDARWRKIKQREKRRLEREARQTGRLPLCALCSRPIDLSLDYNHRESLTLDHIIPLAKGGSLTDPANIRCAHRSCNSSRGAGRRRVDMTPKQRARSDRPTTLVDW